MKGHLASLNGLKWERNNTAVFEERTSSKYIFVTVFTCT
jgi:hypothetical protein